MQTPAPHPPVSDDPRPRSLARAAGRGALGGLAIGLGFGAAIGTLFAAGDALSPEGSGVGFLSSWLLGAAMIGLPATVVGVVLGGLTGVLAEINRMGRDAPACRVEPTAARDERKGPGA